MRPALLRLAFFAAGTMLTIAFAPLGFNALAPLVLLPLLSAFLHARPRDAARLAFWFGAGLFLFGTYWLYTSIHVFGQAPLWVAILLMVGLVVIMGWYFAAIGWLVTVVTDGDPRRLVLAAPAGWVAVEWFRGWFLTGFPWMSIGYSQVDSPLAGWLPAWLAWHALRGLPDAGRPRFVTTVHGLNSPSRYSQVMARGERVICVSDTVRAHVLRHYPATDPAASAYWGFRDYGVGAATRFDLGREAFVQRVWEWKAQSGGTIAQQLRRLGASVDWTRERFTMDEGLSAAVTEVFVKLHEEGLIYRGQRLVNWDPVLLTALSDLEVLPTEEDGKLWHLRYPLEDGSGHLVVATTRPETLLGDAAVAVHPEDERYRHLIGRQVRLPLADRLIPIIGDDFVDREFGSGCVKITPAHDFTDNEVGARHGLPLLNIFTPDARLNDNVPAALRGLPREAARTRVLELLEQAGLIERIEAHRLKVPRGDRSGAVLEPLLTDQWYVKIAPLAAPAIEAVEQGRIRFVPENWSKTYFEWMRNIHDWCIMPNHVHVLVQPAPAERLPNILHTWKSFSAGRINRRFGRTGRLWQPESFDRYIRNEGHLAAATAYIEDNPVKALLVDCPERCRWSSASTCGSTKSLAW